MTKTIASMPSVFRGAGAAAAFARLSARVACARPGRTAPVHAPFTGEAIAELPRATGADIERAVRAARDVQPAWAAAGIRRRSRVLGRFHELVLARKDEALDLIQLEGGKSRINALDEVIDTALVASHYAHHAAGYLRSRRRPGAIPLLTTAYEVRHPVGVVGVISPWNFPLILGITDALAAVAAGNAVVLRPDEQASFTALWAAALLEEAGLPAGVLAVVTGDGPTLGPALVDAVDYIMFTGSTRTGISVAERAARRLIGASLELGGKNPMLVLADADLGAATEGIVRGAFAGAGQVCVSIERCYVHRDVFDAFTRRFTERVRTLRMGAAFDYSADVGSLVNARQLATVARHVDDAVAHGATVLAGGRARPDLGPWFYEPTVLVGVREGMLACAEETFGPVVALYPVDSDEQAITLANDTEFGLNASIWSRDVRRAVAIAKRIRAGTVNVNEIYAATWSATGSPVGGMKKSGLGRRHGAEGILKYTEAQTVAVQRWLPIAPPRRLATDAYERTMLRLASMKHRFPGLR